MTDNGTSTSASAEPRFDLDPRHIAAMADPYTVVNELREKCPVVHSDLHEGFWSVLRYEDVCAIATNASTFSNRDVTIPSENFGISPPPAMSDPPVHMQYRKPFLKHFSPKVIAALEPRIKEKAREFVNNFIERGSVDVATEFSIPFPAFAALHLLGLPEEDLPKFSRWARLIFAIPGENDDDANWQVELFSYFAPLYDARAGATDDSIPSLARRLEIDGREIEQIEYVLLLTVFVTAGLDTTTNALSNILILLDERPDLRAQLIANPEILPVAVEEFLRFITPLPMLARTANHEATIGTGDWATVIGEGEKVALSWLGANHDPAAFSCPEEILLDRSPNRHVAFGVGPHLCIGMHLARVELRAALEEVLARMPDYRVAKDGIERGPALTRQVHHLRIEFAPGPRVEIG